MLIMNLTLLVANAFIELNEKNDVRKIYLKDVIKFNNELYKEATMHNIEYISQINSVSVQELRFNYMAFFNFYETENGYIIELKNGIDVSDIEKNFRINNNENLLKLLKNIDLEKIFRISPPELKLTI